LSQDVQRSVFGARVKLQILIVGSYQPVTSDAYTLGVIFEPVPDLALGVGAFSPRAHSPLKSWA